MNEAMNINELLSTIRTLSLKTRLRLLTRISVDVNADIDKEKVHMEHSLESLFGSWSTVDDSLIDDILNARTISNDRPDFSL